MLCYCQYHYCIVYAGKVWDSRLHRHDIKISVRFVAICRLPSKAVYALKPEISVALYFANLLLSKFAKITGHKYSNSNLVHCIQQAKTPKLRVQNYFIALIAKIKGSQN